MDPGIEEGGRESFGADVVMNVKRERVGKREKGNVES